MAADGAVLEEGVMLNPVMKSFEDICEETLGDLLAEQESGAERERLLCVIRDGLLEWGNHGAAHELCRGWP